MKCVESQYIDRETQEPEEGSMLVAYTPWGIVPYKRNNNGWWSIGNNVKLSWDYLVTMHLKGCLCFIYDYSRYCLDTDAEA